jgi:hypothetical protein
MAASVLAKVPAYRKVTSQAFDEYAGGLGRAVELFLDRAGSHSLELSDEDRAHFRPLGRQRADQGLSIDDLLLSQRVALQSGWRQLTKLVDDLKLPQSALLMTELLPVLVRFMAQVEAELVAGHAEATNDGLFGSAEVLRDVLTGGVEDEAELSARAASCGVDLNACHGLFVVVALGGSEASRQRSQFLSASVSGSSVMWTASADPPHVAVLVPAGSPGERAEIAARWQAAANDDDVIAISAGWLRGFAALRDAYERAHSVLGLATALGVPGVVDLDELLVDRCLQAVPRAHLDELVARTMGPILALSERDRETLIATLWAEHRHHRAASAALTLGVHTKTVLHRRGRVRELTGLDPDHPVDRFRLDLALRAMRVSDAMGTVENRPADC